MLFYAESIGSTTGGPPDSLINIQLEAWDLDSGIASGPSFWSGHGKGALLQQGWGRRWAALGRLLYLSAAAASATVAETARGVALVGVGGVVDDVAVEGGVRP